MRMAIDFRKLNEVTKKDNFPMPRIDEILDKVSNATVFSRLDLRKGYYQILMHDKDKEKTAFSFMGKLYHFKRMPFGLCCAPQTFQRVMQRILGDLDFVEVYLDDVVIHSRTPDEHVDHLRTALDRIKKFNLRLNNEKCQFGKKEIEFLGFSIANGQRRPSNDKCKTLGRFPTPTSKRMLKGFLGLAGYVRHLVEDFAQLAKPLFEASNAPGKFNWSEECERNFVLLKQQLANQSSTFLPNLNKPFIVTCDASDNASPSGGVGLYPTSLSPVVFIGEQRNEKE